MDSISQAVLGAAVGETVLGKKLGNKAVFLGALGGTIPDFDVISGFWQSDVQALVTHRGVTHSIIFCFLAGLFIAYLFSKYFKQTISFRKWFVFWFLCFITHAFLDCLTTWGTQLFWPFDYRVAIKSVFVADPLYTIPFLLCLIVCVCLKRNSSIRRKWNWAGIIISCCYLIFGLYNKYQVHNVFKEALNAKGIEYNRFSTRPTPLNTILWACNVDAEDKYYLAYFRLGEEVNDITFYKKEKNHHLAHKIRQEEEFKILRKITNDNYIMREDSVGNLIMSDLRFGQHDGFLNAEGAFVFEYIFLLDSEKKIINVIQKRNSVENGEEMLKQLWNRVI